MRGKDFFCGSFSNYFNRKLTFRTIRYDSLIFHQERSTFILLVIYMLIYIYTFSYLQLDLHVDLNLHISLISKP